MDTAASRVFEGCGVEATMVAHNAQYHQTCGLKFNNTMLKRAEKRILKTDSDSQYAEQTAACKQIRSRSSVNENMNKLCFFCRQTAGTEGLHQASTFQLDRRVWACALLLEDTDLLTRLSSGDVVALEVNYDAKCLVSMYNRTRKVKVAEMKDTEPARTISATVFANELVLHIDEHVVTRIEQLCSN